MQGNILMPFNKIYIMGGLIVFPIISLVALYRLMFWFPIEIAHHVVGQTASFLTFVIFAVLTIFCFQALTKRN